MELKMLPHTGAAYEEQEILFGGVNYGPAGGAGELAESRNLSAREYPCLSQRQGRRLLPEWEGAEAIYDWFGKLIVCRGGTLYIDEKAVAEVTPGPKQFAVVNTQLIVWPDRIAVSLTEERVVADCRAVTTTEADGLVTVYRNSVTAPFDVRQESRVHIYIGAWRSDYFSFHTYGKDREAFKACWDTDPGAWNEEKLSDLEEIKYCYNGIFALRNLEVGDILRVDSSADLICGGQNTKPDKTQYTPSDHYAVITNVVTGGLGEEYECRVSFDIFRVSRFNPPLATLFAVGDWISVGAGVYGMTGAERTKITGINQQTNQVYFSTALRIPAVFCERATDKALNTTQMCKLIHEYEAADGEIKTAEKFFCLPERIPAGCILFCTSDDCTIIVRQIVTEEPECDEEGNIQFDENGDVIYVTETEVVGYIPERVRFWDPSQRVEYGPYPANITNGPVGAVLFDCEDYPVPTSVTLQRALPEMDYICGHENRLWGVSNKTRTIYASELGKPFSFYEDYDISTGAWAVPVGSDGDFTGCIGYGANVLFWKEDRLHKLLGSSPEDFTIYEYAQRGVEEGSAGSMVILNEILYFKTREGIAAFAGGVPQLISGGFGLRRFRDAVGGTDGERYYVSMQDLSDGEWGVWVYDPKLGIWLQEREGRDAGYAMRLGEFYTLTDGSVYATYATDAFEADGEWSATFCEITETVHGRKKYSQLKLRYVLDPGAELKAEIRCDGGEWKTLAFHKNTDGRRTAVLPIRPNRCDRFQIRLSGRGYCRVESLVRRFRVGGDG